MDGLSAPEVSEKLGVKADLLYRWKREHVKELEGTIESTSGSSPTEMGAEIDRLRKELAKSNRINEILKKTVGYFAREE